MDAKPLKTWKIPDGTPQASCKGCQATIYWIKTYSGKNMPLNPDGTSHFDTCPVRDQFRNQPVAQTAAERTDKVSCHKCGVFVGVARSRFPFLFTCLECAEKEQAAKKDEDAQNHIDF